MTRPIVQLELNEVPWRVVDWYVAKRPGSALAACLREATTFTTFTQDVGELHPWTTWPTMHRGVTNERHGITFINQAIPPDFPPVWELVADKLPGRVGVFGSLQSCGVFPREPGKYAFFVPDTFATTSMTHPSRYEAFQGFNLRMTKMDGAVAKPVAMNGSTISMAARLFGAGFPLSLGSRLAAHLVRERIDSAYRTRRSVLQAPVAFHFYWDALKRFNPIYSTFFTNHVAGMMHRYWKHAFPGDFNLDEHAFDGDGVRATNILFAMDEADRIVARLAQYCRMVDGALLIASSMGQEAIDRGAYFGEYRLVDAGKLFRAVGFSGPYELQLAMQPDFSFRFDSDGAVRDLDARLARLVMVDEGDARSFRIKCAGATANLGIAAKPMSREETRFAFIEPDGTRRALAPGDLGLERLERDPGTGYHQPRGIAILHVSGAKGSDRREEVLSTRIAPTLLRHFGVAPRGYMPEPLDEGLRYLAAARLSGSTSVSSPASP